MENHSKRKADDGTGNVSKKKKQWKTPKKGQVPVDRILTTINAGDAGIWVTCDMHREAKCIAECRDLFNEYADMLYADLVHDTLKEEPVKEEPVREQSVKQESVKAKSAEEEAVEEESIDDIDIEKEIQEEIKEMKDARKEALFLPINVDIQCVMFFKTRQPVDPVSFVHKICSDAAASARTKTSRWIKRLTPMTRMGKASEKGLEEVSKIVLAPAFHSDVGTSKKFAIRTTIRNNNAMKRDDVIKQVANAVGTRHSVNLKHYDLLILVDIYRNILGMSVVDGDFEKLKRFNLAEIYEPTPKPES